jgi:hypothetical protein
MRVSFFVKKEFPISWEEQTFWNEENTVSISEATLDNKTL